MRAQTRTPDLSRWVPGGINAGRFRFGVAVVAAPVHTARSFGQWISEARPDYQWTARHFVAMQAVLDRVTSGELRRVYFQVPIRHGKTEHNTVGYAVSRLEANPKTRILVGSYNQRKAEKFSRDIRKLAVARGVEMSPDRNAAGEWETAAGGGVLAVGAGAGVASVNADLILIDDPIGSRDDAESQAKRDQVWDWLTNDILARCEPQTAVVMTMSRWQMDDPAGRLRDQQGARWHILDLPAEAEAGDPLGRTPGEPLWPELRNAAWLQEKRDELGAYGFAALLQGRPRPRDGGMFKWEWWKLFETVPAVGQMVRYWDTAGTEAKRTNDPDYTVGALLCRMPDGRTAVVDLARFRHSVGQRDAEIANVARLDASRYPGRVRWWLEREAGVGGKDRTDALKRLVQNTGIPISDEPATGNKATRAEPLASAVEAGNVLLCPDAPDRLWRDALRSEAADFPAGNHDDQVDAVAGAFNKLAVDTTWRQTRVAF